MKSDDEDSNQFTDFQIGSKSPAELTAELIIRSTVSDPREALRCIVGAGKLSVSMLAGVKERGDYIFFIDESDKKQFKDGNLAHILSKLTPAGLFPPMDIRSDDSDSEKVIIKIVEDTITIKGDGKDKAIEEAVKLKYEYATINAHNLLDPIFFELGKRGILQANISLSDIALKMSFQNAIDKDLEVHEMVDVLLSKKVNKEFDIDAIVRREIKKKFHNTGSKKDRVTKPVPDPVPKGDESSQDLTQMIDDELTKKDPDSITAQEEAKEQEEKKRS